MGEAYLCTVFPTSLNFFSIFYDCPHILKFKNFPIIQKLHIIQSKFTNLTQQNEKRKSFLPEKKILTFIEFQNVIEILTNNL
jgi:hypothetical protein